jgi:hypothetical protein
MDYKLTEYPCTCLAGEPMCPGCAMFWTELGREIPEKLEIEEC